MTTDTWLGQIKNDGTIPGYEPGAWVDYARGTEADSRAWQAKDPENRRIVDWIDKQCVHVPESLPRPSLQEEAERLISYWERHGDNSEAVAKWAVSDLLNLARQVVEEESK